MEKPGDVLDFSDVHGQKNVKLALEVAVAGRHNLLIIGLPEIGNIINKEGRLPSEMLYFTVEY